MILSATECILSGLSSHTEAEPWIDLGHLNLWVSGYGTLYKLPVELGKGSGIQGAAGKKSKVMTVANPSLEQVK